MYNPDNVDYKTVQVTDFTMPSEEFLKNSIWKVDEEINNRKILNTPTFTVEKQSDDSDKSTWYYIWFQAKKSFELDFITLHSNFDANQYSKINAK